MTSQFETIPRPTVPALDRALGQPFGVLDHGFIRLIDYMGDEGAITQAARVSYGRGTKTVSEDRGLIRYLLRQHHTTPFEMCEVKLHVKLPVYVARQWVRHRTANINEYSARYSILESEFHIPDRRDLAPQSTTNKQGREGGYGKHEADTIRSMIESAVQYSDDTYRALIDEDDCNLSREQARIVMPLNTYTEWYWKIDLHNLLHFLRLRADPHAQKEIRDYAAVICDLVRVWVPNVWEAFEDYQLNSMTLSRMEIAKLAHLIRGQETPDDGMSNRERAEFEDKLGRLGWLAE